MKIIHLISGGDVGGAKTHVYTLLSGLAKTDEVLLVCFKSGPFVEEAAALGIPTQVMDGSLRSSVRQLTTLIRERGFEIVHCHGSRANLVGSMLKKKLDLPTVTTVHSDYRRDYMGRPLAALTYGMLNRHALRKMDYWIGVSDVTVDMLNERGFDPNRTFVIFNGVPIRTDPPALDRNAYLRSLGIEPTEHMTVFGIAARINPVKDMTTLIRAFSSAVQTCPEIRLIIAGDGEQRQQMEALASQTCPKGTVVFAGWIEDTHSFYSAIDVNMLTSVSEGFPYALPEGASRRCATIATRVGGVPSLVKHEVNGLLFEPKDVETLSGYMIRLAQNPEQIRRFGEQIFEDTKSRFSVEATVRRQREIYETILRRCERAKTHPRDGIFICGAYGKGNSGDDAILKSMVTELRKRDPDIPICVASRSPKQTAKDVRARGIYTFRTGKIRRQLKKTSLYLSGGGSLIQDSTSSRSLWYYLSSIRTAKKQGCKVMMFSCGIGPVRWKANRRRASRIIESCVDLITLRDEASLAEFRSLPVTSVPTLVTADIALLIPPAPESELLRCCAEAGLDAEGRWMLIAPRPWDGMRQHYGDFSRAAVYAAQTYGLTPVFLAMEPGKDHAVCEDLAAMTAGQTPCLVLDAPEEASLAAGLIRRADCVLGMRLHSLILAAAGGIPFSGVAYDPKVSGFMEYVHQGTCCELADVTAEKLCAMVDFMQSHRESYRRVTENLTARVEDNCRLAFELIS